MRGPGFVITQYDRLFGITRYLTLGSSSGHQHWSPRVGDAEVFHNEAMARCIAEHVHARDFEVAEVAA